MLKIFGSNGTFDLILNEIYYWYLSGTAYNFYLRNQELMTIVFLNEEDARNCFIQIMNSEFEHTASIVSTSGVVYNINCKNLLSNTRSTATLSIVFPGKTLSVVCEDVTRATDHNNYLSNVLYSCNLSKHLLGANISRVNPMFTDDIGNKTYNDIQTAITNSSSGDFVIIEKSDTVYLITSAIVLKDNVTLIFEEGSTIETNGSTKIFSNDDVAMSVKILGLGIFKSSNKIYLGTNGSANMFDVFFTAKKCIAKTNTLWFPENGTTLLKVKEFETNGILVDSDGDVNVVDCDFLSCINVGFPQAGTQYLVFPANNINTRYYFRNGYVRHRECYFDTSGGVYDIHYINIRYNSYDILANFPSNACNLYFYNTIFKSDLLTGFSTSCFDPINVYFKSHCIFSLPVQADAVISGTYSISDPRIID